MLKLSLDLGDRRAVHAVNKRRNQVTPEALRRVADIAQAHPKREGARSDRSQPSMAVPFGELSVSSIVHGSVGGGGAASGAEPVPAPAQRTPSTVKISERYAAAT